MSFDAVLSIDGAFQASKRDAIAGWLADSDFVAAEVLMAGDTNHDREIARELGCAFMHFDGGHQEHAPGDTRARTLSEVVALILGARRERMLSLSDAR